jgi:hypothetical protein
MEPAFSEAAFNLTARARARARPAPRRPVRGGGASAWRGAGAEGRGAQVGEVSGPVSTPSGVHIIKRLE